MVSQRRYASSRQASIQSGSFFLAEMNRTVSSERPLGAFSDSISVTNPYLYWSTSIRRTCSTVSCTAGILPSAHGCKDRGLDLSVMVGSLFALRSFLVAPPQAAFACLLSNDETTLFQAVNSASRSASVVVQPRLTRTAPRESEGSTPIAASTCDACTLPDEHAEPEETAIPLRSKAIIAVSAFRPGTANNVVLGRSGTPAPKTTAWGVAALRSDSSRSRRAAIRVTSICVVAKAAAPKPARATTFSVPARCPRSCPPPLINGSAIWISPRRTSAPAP